MKNLLTNNYYTVGLNTNPINNLESYPIDYKWYINGATPTIEIYEENGIDNERQAFSSTDIINTNTHEANDICEIIYENSTMKFSYPERLADTEKKENKRNQVPEI